MGKENFWQLGRAVRYTDQAVGKPKLSSVHQFGWRHDLQGFRVEIMHGLGVVRSADLPVPVELAAAFLVRCTEPAFNDQLFSARTLQQAEEATFELGKVELKVERGVVRAVPRPTDDRVGLTLSTNQEGSARIFLYHELRTQFGRRMRKLSPEEIRTHLRAPVAA